MKTLSKILVSHKMISLFNFENYMIHVALDVLSNYAKITLFEKFSELYNSVESKTTLDLGLYRNKIKI